MPDQRLYKRRHLLYYLDVFERGSGAKLGHLGDLTAQGMLLLADRQYVKGARLALEIDLTPLSGLPGGSFAVNATVIWCADDGSPLYHLVGLAFDELGSTEAAIVRMLLKVIAFAD
jgi:hypothetical protein